jgi:DNA-binding response OmpR family regulator
MRVLVAEDFSPLRESLVEGLREAGFAVDEAEDGGRALTKVRQDPYDAVILDIMLPKIDGFEVLRTMRSEGIDYSVLILTARSEVDDRVRGLDSGADDYLIKPFAFEELLARLRALVRRNFADRSVRLELRDLAIDTSAQRVTRRGKDIELTAREYGLLEYMARRAGEIVTRDDVWNHVYDFSSTATSNVIDVYIGYLRRKLDEPGRPSHIETVRGRGYRMTKATSED